MNNTIKLNNGTKRKSIQMILIGSKALQLRVASLINRIPSDYDFICTEEKYQSWFNKNKSKLSITKQYDLPEFNKKIIEGSPNIEFEIVKENTSAALLYDLITNDPDTIKTDNFGLVPSINILFAIKDTHKYKKFDTVYGCKNFFKHALDWHSLNQFGAKIKPEYNAFIDLRKKETYNYHHPSLTNQTKETFFSDNFYIYDHDSLHETVKHLDKPAYQYYSFDDDPIKSDKNKFYSADYKIRLYGVLEESSVLCLERALIPHYDYWNGNLWNAWRFAYAKVATSITSGFF